jgi:CsoR family transcriptional regulator, copper-sensing transcriptional repressor
MQSCAAGVALRSLTYGQEGIEMMTLATREDLIRRLRLIEGQARGVQRMLEEGRECREVLNQLASIRAATQSVSQALARQYALQLLSERACADGDAAAPMADNLGSGSGSEARGAAAPDSDLNRIIDLLLHLPS